MNIKKCLFNLAIATGAFSLAACTDYDNGYEADRLAYQKNFVDMFGNIDPNQDWNMAEHNSVVVTPGKSSDIKIYAKNGAGYQLIASYNNVKAKQKLPFDVIQGTETVLVSDGITAQTVNVGSSVSFNASTRTIVEGTSYGSIKVKQLPDYRYFTTEEITNYTRVAPEGSNNTKNVTCNYTLMSNGKFIIYPVYWQTSSWSNIGIYFKDAEGEVHTVEIYKMKEGDDFQYWNSTHHYDSHTPIGDWSSYTHAHLNGALDGCGTYNDGEGHEYRLRSKGIEVDIPAGTVFGMYVEVQSNVQDELADNLKWKNYSEAILNSSEKRSTTSGDPKEYINSQCIDKSLAAFYTVGDYTYFSFEDWNPDNDLNDMVFMFGGNIPTSTDNEATEWIVACEDLASTSGDNDFNDVVFKVSHGDNYTTANVTPLATGAKYKAELFYGTTIGEAQLLGEIHDMIRPEVAKLFENGSMPFMNTQGSMDQYGAGQQITISVDPSFSMAEYTPEEMTVGETKSETNMGNFMIRSHRDTEDGGTEMAYIVASDRGEAPTMFCVPATYQVSEGVKAAWVWPKEYNSIGNAYPDFADWVSNGSNKDWYKHMNAGEVVSGNYLTYMSEGSSSDLNKMHPMKLDKTQLSLSIGEHQSVGVSGESNGDITVICGDPSVASATVDGRMVTITANGAGNATVVVHQEASTDGKYPEQNKTVNVKVFAAANELAATPTSLTFEPGSAAQQITYTTNSDAAVVVASTDDDVLTVSHNAETKTITVTPKAPGSAAVSISQNDTETIPGKIVTVPVTVNGYGTEVYSGNYDSSLYFFVVPTTNISTPATVTCVVEADYFNGSLNVYYKGQYSNTMLKSATPVKLDNNHWMASFTLSADEMLNFTNNEYNKNILIGGGMGRNWDNPAPMTIKVYVK